MPFTLKLDFRGLIAAVPVDGGDSLKILFVEARQGRQTSDGEHIPPHYPVAQFERKNVVDPSFLAEHDVEGEKLMVLGSDVNNSQNGLKVLWFLADQELAIHFDGQAPARGSLLFWNENLARLNDARFTGKNPDQFFSFVPRIEEIAPTAARVDLDCLRSQPRQGLISSRFTVTEGLVQAIQLQRTADSGLTVPLEFRPIGAPADATVIKKPASSGVQVEIKIPGDSVTLVSTKFGSGETQPVVTLAPAPGQDDPVTLEVWNVPLEEFLNLPHPMGAGHATQDKHFEAFYELSQQRLPLHLRPVPHFEIDGNGNGNGHHPANGHMADDQHPIRITDPYCPPATFQG